MLSSNNYLIGVCRDLEGHNISFKYCHISFDLGKEKPDQVTNTILKKIHSFSKNFTSIKIILAAAEIHQEPINHIDSIRTLNCNFFVPINLIQKIVASFNSAQIEIVHFDSFSRFLPNQRLRTYTSSKRLLRNYTITLTSKHSNVSFKSLVFGKIKDTKNFRPAGFFETNNFLSYFKSKYFLIKTPTIVKILKQISTAKSNDSATRFILINK